MQKIDFMLSTVEIAEMLDNTPHKDILKKLEGRTQKNGKHIKGYIEILTERQMSPSDFFIPSTYKDSSGKENKCYKVTKKGCEFLANKFTGEKGVLFTARYINRFHEMQDILSGQEAEPGLPWFIRRFRGNYIMLFRDFKSLTGVEMFGNYTAWKREGRLVAGYDYNGWGWYTVIDKDKFLQEYGFEYGDDDCMYYLYPCGIRKALEIYRRESGRKLDQEAYDAIADGLEAIEPPKKELVLAKQNEAQKISNVPPIQISIVVGGEQKVITGTREVTA